MSLAPAARETAFGPARTFERLDDAGLRDELRKFSGLIAYETTFRKDAPADLWLDLGRLHQASEVFLNGRSLGVRICPPHVFHPGRISTGKHTLRIEIATTLVGKLGDNGLDRAMPEDPPYLIGPVKLVSQECQASGTQRRAVWL